MMKSFKRLVMDILADADARAQCLADPDGFITANDYTVSDSEKDRLVKFLGTDSEHFTPEEVSSVLAGGHHTNREHPDTTGGDH